MIGDTAPDDLTEDMAQDTPLDAPDMGDWTVRGTASDAPLPDTLASEEDGPPDTSLTDDLLPDDIALADDPMPPALEDAPDLPEDDHDPFDAFDDPLEPIDADVSGSTFVLTPPTEAAPKDAIALAGRRIFDIAQPRNDTDRMIGKISKQLSRIVLGDYDFRVELDTDVDNIHLQKLTMLVNLALDDVRRNVSDLKALANRLDATVKDRTRRMDLVISGSNDGVWVWTIATDNIEFSRRWHEMIGCSDCVTVSDWIDRIHTEDREAFQIALRAHLQGLTDLLQEQFRIRHADGTYRWMWCRGRCDRDEAGRPKLMAGTLTDVHEFRTVDDPTGLPNESALMNYLDGLIAAELPFGVVMAGLPEFRAMLEVLPPEALNLLRTQIARRLSRALPYNAYLIRMTGDFFMIVSTDEALDEGQMGKLAETLLRAFAQPFAIDGRSLTMPLTLGATRVYTPTLGPQSSDEVLREAWMSYRAARHSSQPFNVLTEKQTSQFSERSTTEAMIRTALSRGWFVPFYQPIVDGEDRSYCGYEVLCRLHHPETGVWPTGDFIDIAREIGLLPSITRVMISRALGMLAEWRRDGAPGAGHFVSVNIDAQDLAAAEFLPWLRDLLNEHGVPPWQLTLEINEASLMGNLAGTAEASAALRDLGVKIALDDFGTGYSSLTYLNQIDVDWIKIDRSFVAGLATDGRKRSMVRMIAVLAQQIGAQVCVDGVEEDDQMAALSEHAVDLFQGFLFGRPVSRQDIEAALRPPDLHA